MYKVVVSREAKIDIARLEFWWTPVDEDVAERAGAAIRETIETLADRPDR